MASLQQRFSGLCLLMKCFVLLIRISLVWTTNIGLTFFIAEKGFELYFPFLSVRVYGILGYKMFTECWWWWRVLSLTCGQAGPVSDVTIVPNNDQDTDLYSTVHSTQSYNDQDTDLYSTLQYTEHSHIMTRILTWTLQYTVHSQSPSTTNLPWKYICNATK